MRTLLLALAFTATPAFAQANPQIDYPGFQALTASVAPARATRLIAFDAFQAEAAKPGTLLLDARSKDAFPRGHIKGAVNITGKALFTADGLAQLPRDKQIVLNCYSGQTASQATAALRDPMVG